MTCPVCGGTQHTHVDEACYKARIAELEASEAKAEADANRIARELQPLQEENAFLKAEVERLKAELAASDDVSRWEAESRADAVLRSVLVKKALDGSCKERA